MKKILSSFLLVCLVAPAGALAINPPSPVTPTVIPKTPEEACFSELIRAAKSSPSFSGIDFTRVQKSNPGFGQSKNFSLANYTDFLIHAALPVPFNLGEIKRYPLELDKVAAGGLSDANRVYKSNRTNVGTLMYTDGSNTPFQVDGTSYSMDGYYVDTKVATFGILSDFVFPVRSRDEKRGNPYIYGDTYDDFRQYVMYTHHLTSKVEPDPEKRFLSCGIVKTQANGGYSFRDIQPEGYGGNTFTGSSYNVYEDSPILTSDSHRFLRGDVRIQTVNTSDYVTPYFYFDVITMAYNNNSSFHNEFKTLPLQEQSMTNPAIQGRESAMRDAIINFNLLVQNELSLGIAGSLQNESGVTSSISGSDLLTSVVGNKQPTGGLAIGEGVSLDTFQEVLKIEDDTLRSYLQVAMEAGYEKVFEGKKDEELDPFHLKMKNCPLTFEEKQQNIKQIIQNYAGTADPNTLKYTHLEFGECVVPYLDVRQRVLLENNPFDEAINTVQSTNKEQLEALQDTEVDLTDILNVQEFEMKAKDLQTTFTNDIQSLSTASETYSSCGIDLLALKLRLDRGEIRQEEFDTQAKIKKDACNREIEDAVQGVSLVDVSTLKNTTLESDVEAQFSSNEPEPKSPKVLTEVEEEPKVENSVDPVDDIVPSKSLWEKQWVYFVISGFFAFFALALLLFGTKKND